MARGDDPLQPFGTQQGHVDGGGGYQQPLVSADVRGRLGATDMSLAGLQAGLAFPVQRQPAMRPRTRARRQQRKPA